MASDRRIKIATVAHRYDVCTKTIRRWMAAHAGRIPPPVSLSPLRWRESDIDLHIRRSTVLDELRERAGARP